MESMVMSQPTINAKRHWLQILNAFLQVCLVVSLASCGTESTPPTTNHPFAGGAGTPEDPFQIATIEQLQAIDDTLWLDKHFVQVQDIDASASADFEEPGVMGKGFNAIGDNINPFVGSYDGNNYSIKDIFLNFYKSRQTNGLFGYLKNAEIKNIQVDNDYQSKQTNKQTVKSLKKQLIDSQDHINMDAVNSEGGTGGLAGANDGGLIKNCHFKGFVPGFFGVSAGGFVGVNTGVIEDSSFEGTGAGAGFVYTNKGIISRSIAKGSINLQSIAGFVKYNLGEIIDSYADVELNGTFASAGFNLMNRGSIRSSFIRGNIRGNQHVGGFVLQNYGHIQDSYVAAKQEVILDDVDAEYLVAGFVTENYEGATIENVFVSEKVTIGGSIEWLKAIGSISAVNNGSIESAYWDLNRTGIDVGIDQGSPEGATGLTTAEMTGLSAEQNMPGFDWVNVWRTTEDRYPVLRWEEE